MCLLKTPKAPKSLEFCNLLSYPGSGSDEVGAGNPGLIGSGREIADIYNWFTEGFDTADLKDAKGARGCV